MLDFVRKHAKSWLVKVALALIIIVFIFWGGFTYQSRHETEMAQVGDQYISVSEYNSAYSNMLDMYRRQLGPSFSEEMLQKLNLKSQMLEMLIGQSLVLQGAEALGLSANQEEIRKHIMELPYFQADGRFDKAQYDFALRQMRLSPEKYEQQIAQEITFRKAESFIKNRAVVTEQEILIDHHFNRDQIRLAYVPIDPKSFEDQVAIDAAAVQAFYNENLARYMEPEKREIVHVLVSSEELAKDVSLGAEDARRYYEEHENQYKREKEVHARHILIKVNADAPEEEVEKARTEAQKILEEAKSGQDFAELAKKYSQDEGSAKQGGDLGFFSAKMMIPEFSTAAFALQAGQIADLVKTSFGFHIIKVEEVREAKTTPFEEVKGDIERQLKLQTAQDLAFKKARELRDLAYARKDLAKAAEEMKIPVAGTVWIEQKGNQEGAVPFPPEFKARLFDLYSGDISESFETPTGFQIAQVKSIKAPQATAFEQVKEKVEKDYRAGEARKIAEKKASELLALARTKNSIEEAAKQQNSTVRQSELFSRQSPDKDLKLLRGENINNAFALTESNPFPDKPLEMGNRFIVCQLMARNPAAQPSQEEKSAISQRLLQQKQASVWETWINELRKSIKVEKFKQV